VQAAHDAGIVHRDLKPDNVMWDPATRRVKLLDFGIAADQGQNADERLTRAGFFVGTLMYVAPEALSGAMVTPRPTSTRSPPSRTSCSRLPPVHGQVAARDVHRSSSRSRRSRSARPKEGCLFAPASRQAVMRGSAKDPHERYPNVRAFAAALALARGRPRAGGAPAAGAPPARRRAAPARGRRLVARIRGLFKKG
jgi:serine/threonine-protein kinase